jgi:drug/metabolite transporter (DMT)-like permease
VLFLIGQSLTLASHSSLLFATVPIFIYILAIIFLNEKPTVRRTAGILIATAGVYYILSGGKARFGLEYLLGDILVLVAVVAWAVGTVMLKPLAIRYGAFRVTGLALSYGSIVYFPYGIYRAFTWDYASVSQSAWLSVFYLALVVSIICYFLWYWILKYMEASRVAVFQNMQPVIASAAAVMMLAEPISTNFVVGGVVVIFGVILTEVKNGPKHLL